MRYFLIIALAFTVISCGKSGNSVTNPEEPEAKGGVAFTFNSSNAKVAADFPEPTNVRVLVRRFENNDLKFNAMTDVEVPTDTTVVISVPANDGYQIDAFSYKDSTVSLKPIFKVDQVSGISVTPDNVTNVSLVLESISPSFTIPDSVEQGDNFDITANMDGFFNVSASYTSQYLVYLKADSSYQNEFTNENTDYSDVYGSGSNNLEWNAVSISEFGGQNAYFQIIAKLAADEFYRSDENKFSFVLNYPNPYITDTLKTFVKIPEGGIGVDVTY